MQTLNLTFQITKEILVFLFVILVFILVVKNKYLSNSTLITKLKILFLCGILIPLIYFSFTIFFPEGNNNYFNGLTANRVINSIFSGIFSILISSICIVILIMIYELLMFRRKKHTERNFKILIFFFIVYIFWTNVTILSLQRPPGDLIPKEIDINILWGIILLPILLDLLKSSWVEFLNKKEKLLALAGSLFVIYCMVEAYNYPVKNTLFYFSKTLGSFQVLTLIYFLIYASFSFINILLHLPSAGLFDKKVKQLSSLHKLSSSVASVLDIEKLVIEIVNYTYDITNSDSVCLLIRDEENKPFTIAASKNLLPDDTILVNIESEGNFNKRILSAKSSLIINELEKELFSSGTMKGSLIGVPLISSKLGTIGILYAHKNSTYGFSDEEDFMLKTFANHAVVAIENARYFKESLKKREFEKELVVAKKIQDRMLPAALPAILNIEIAALNLPCKEIGGDYYDLIKLDEHKLGIAIADVSGKGIPASLIMSNLQACLRILSRENLSVHEIVSKINDIIYENTDDYQYITFFYGVIDIINKKFTYCNAGHNPPILLHQDGTEILLKDGGLILGWMEKTAYTEKEIEIRPGDQIILYTDGVVESMNSAEEEFDEWRLKQIIKENKEHPPQKIIDAIVRGIKSHIADSPQIDDLTLVALRIAD